jgi:hypothetical protein
VTHFFYLGEGFDNRKLTPVFAGVFIFIKNLKILKIFAIKMPSRALL